MFFLFSLTPNLIQDIIQRKNIGIVKALATILFINYGEGFESSPISPHYSNGSLYQNHLAKKNTHPQHSQYLNRQTLRKLTEYLAPL